MFWPARARASFIPNQRGLKNGRHQQTDVLMSVFKYAFNVDLSFMIQAKDFGVRSYPFPVISVGVID